MRSRKTTPSRPAEAAATSPCATIPATAPEAANSPTESDAKVVALRTAITSGTFRVDSMLIAERILRKGTLGGERVARDVLFHPA